VNFWLMVCTAMKGRNEALLFLVEQRREAPISADGRQARHHPKKKNQHGLNPSSPRNLRPATRWEALRLTPTASFASGRSSPGVKPPRTQI